MYYKNILQNYILQVVYYKTTMQNNSANSWVFWITALENCYCKTVMQKLYCKMCITKIVQNRKFSKIMQHFCITKKLNSKFKFLIKKRNVVGKKC